MQQLDLFLFEWESLQVGGYPGGGACMMLGAFGSDASWCSHKSGYRCDFTEGDWRLQLWAALIAPVWCESKHLGAAWKGHCSFQ